jgi:valyl-tRNA synthetase
MYDATMPFKSVFIHDLVRDSKGKKMSKTNGNIHNSLIQIIKFKNGNSF